MTSSKESWSPEKLAEQLLKFLQNSEHESIFKLWKEHGIPNDEVFEQLRVQSGQFASIYPLLEGDNPALRYLLSSVLCCCSESSVSANLLAKERRVWEFLVASFNDDLVKEIEASRKKCGTYPAQTIMHLIPYVCERTWEFVVQCGLLNHLLSEMQKMPRTCNSIKILGAIIVVLGRRKTQGSIDTLVSGGLFRLLGQLIQKSGNLLKGTPPCPECNCSSNKDMNVFSDRFLGVKKKSTNYLMSIHILGLILTKNYVVPILIIMNSFNFYHTPMSKSIFVNINRYSQSVCNSCQFTKEKRTGLVISNRCAGFLSTMNMRDVLEPHASFVVLLQDKKKLT